MPINFLNKAINERIKALRQALNMTQSDFAEKIGVTQSYLSKIERNEAIVTQTIVAAISFFTGVNYHWLLTGEGEMFIDKPVAQPVTEDINKYIGKDFVLIPMVSGKISAGKGLSPVEDAEVEMKLAFRLDWIRRKGDYTKMSLIRVEGDSMEPTLYSGDIVLVDGNRSFIDLHGGIYAILVNDSIMIKRIQLIFTEKKLKIISDNPKYEPLIVSPEDVHVIGKVIWIGREIERI